jgi:hypothetical protein
MNAKDTEALRSTNPQLYRDFTGGKLPEPSDEFVAVANEYPAKTTKT